MEKVKKFHKKFYKKSKILDIGAIIYVGLDL